MLNPTRSPVLVFSAQEMSVVTIQGLHSNDIMLASPLYGFVLGVILGTTFCQCILSFKMLHFIDLPHSFHFFSVSEIDVQCELTQYLRAEDLAQ